MIDTPTTTSDWLVAFCHRYDKTRKSRETVANRKPRRTKFNTMNRYHVRAVDEKRMRMERVNNGYVFPFAREIAGRVRQPFIEQGLRTFGNPILKLFVSRIPRGGKARASDNKADLYVPYWSKLLTLDCPYIEGTKQFLSFIRLDCDAVFSSAEACVQVLQGRVDAGSIPHLPHIIVGDELPNGNFANPHFLFMLEVGVWNNEKDARCRQTPIRLFEAVSRGLTSALLDIGVDPGAPQGTLRCKNPISPIWRTITPNAEHFMSLKEYAAALKDMKSTRPDLIRRAAELQSGMGKLKSNELFNKLLDFGIKQLANWHFSRDERIRLPVDELGNAIYDSMAAYVSSSGLSEERAAYVIEKVATHLAVSFDPKKLDKPRARKRLAHIVEDMPTVEDRQRAGAVYAHRARNKKSLDTLKSAVVGLRDAGKLSGMSKEAISIRSGVSRAFVYKHLDAVLQEIAA
ncbi:replication initiation protein [Agrobacterium genomosp. 2]|uniref:Uncharacterized protein n=1 Tax=Agrobacterium genomosp. 2 str. CFBP 5494 TaxID=1183436 RepID=A0A9W5B256_9HYPH|nr:replication initiation protein [Agrobacterium genomosp. 2]CUW93674.1 hypothetical protein AGR2A_Cc70079 [Agrobacterium genomosp. 2 str. CFBP 5494]